MSDHRQITLLAMAPSGETFLARDERGQVWLYQPLGAGAPEIVSESLVERAVADHGFDRIDQSFASWQALDEFRQRRAIRLAERVTVDRDALTLDDVERLLKVAHRWLQDGETGRASRLLTSLLRLPSVRADAPMNDRLLSLLETLAAPPRVVPRPLRTDATAAAAHDRWERTLNVAA